MAGSCKSPHADNKTGRDRRLMAMTRQYSMSQHRTHIDTKCIDNKAWNWSSLFRTQCEKAWCVLQNAVQFLSMQTKVHLVNVQRKPSIDLTIHWWMRYMHQWTSWSLFQIVICCLGTKPLSQPMLTYVDPMKNAMNFESICNKFHWMKCIHKCCL